MRVFDYSRADDTATAVSSYADGSARRDPPDVTAPIQYLVGGTTLLDLMKLDVIRPARVIEINGFQWNTADIVFSDGGLRLGAMTRMAQAADHPQVREAFPVLAQSLQLAASGRSATWPRSAAMSCNAPAAPIFAIRPIRTATSARRAPAARRWRVSIASMRCWAPAKAASPPIPAISRRRCWRSRLWSISPGLSGRAPSPSPSCTAHRQDQLVQRQIRHRSTEPGVLGLQFLQPLHLVALQAAILIPPSIIGNFRHADRSDRVCHRPALCHQHINLPKLRNDLFSRMPLPCHRSDPPSEKHTSGRTTSKGADHL